jgi:hypothetical protein
VLTDTQILIELLKVTEEKSQELVNTYAQKMKDLQVYSFLSTILKNKQRLHGISLQIKTF